MQLQSFLKFGVLAIFGYKHWWFATTQKCKLQLKIPS